MWGAINLDYPDQYENTVPEVPKIPFPGVAPVVTVRRQGDGSYDQGVDMQDGKGRAKNYCFQNYGAGGTLGVDPGMHDQAAPKVVNEWGWPIVATPKKAKRGK